MTKRPVLNLSVTDRRAKKMHSVYTTSRSLWLWRLLGLILFTVSAPFHLYGQPVASFEIRTDEADFVVDTLIVFDASESSGDFAYYRWEVVGETPETTTTPIYSRIFTSSGRRTIMLLLLDAAGNEVAVSGLKSINIQAAGGVLPKMTSVSVRVDDSASPSPDGIANPGETALLFVTIRNDGGETGYSTVGTMYPVTPGLEIEATRSVQDFRDVAPGDTAENLIAYQVTIPASAMPGELVHLQIMTSYQVGIAGRSGVSLVHVSVRVDGETPTPAPTPPDHFDVVFSGHQVIRDVVPGLLRSGDGVINSGETVSLALRVTNRGAAAVTGLSATVSSQSSEVVPSNGIVTWDSIPPGSTSQSTNAVDVTISSSAEEMQAIPLSVRLTGPGEFSADASLKLWVLKSVNLGPLSGNGIQPYGVAYVPSVNRLYVTNIRSNNVSVVDPTVKQVVACIPVARGPQNILYYAANNQLFVGHRNTPIVSVIDPRTNTLVNQIRLDETNAVSDLALDPSLGFLLVAHDDIDQISVVQLSDLTMLGRLGGISSLGAISYSSLLGTLVYLDPNRAMIVAGDQPLQVDGIIRGDTLAVDDQSGMAYLGGARDGTDGLFAVSLTDGSVAFLALNQAVRSLAVDPNTGMVFAGLVQTPDNKRTLVKIDPTIGAIVATSTAGSAFASILVGKGPHSGRLFLTETFRYQLQILDASSLKFKGIARLGNSPRNVAVDHARGRIYVTNRDTFSISVIDTASGRLLETFLAGMRPGGLAFNPALDLAYAALEDQDAILELSTGGVLRRLRDLKVGVLPVQIALDKQRSRVIVTSALSGLVTVIDPYTGGVRTAEAGQEPFGVVANEGLGIFYVAAQGSSEIFAFNAEDVSLIRSLKLDVDSSPAALALDPKTNRIFAGMLGPKEIWAFDADLNRISTLTAYVGDIINWVAVDSIRRRLYVSALNTGQLRVFDLDTFEFLRAVDIGRAPYGIGVDEETAMVYVAAEVGGVVTFYKDPDKVLPTLPPPASVLADVGDSRVRLVWSNVGGAKGYVVERTQSGLDFFVPINSLPLPADVNEFSDTDVLNGVGYQYQVRAVGDGRRLGAATKSDVVFPHELSEPQFTLSTRARHLRVLPGESGKYSLTLRAKPGFFSPLSFSLQGAAHPRITSNLFTPGSMPAPGAPSLSRLRVAVSSIDYTYAKLPLQVVASSPGQKEKAFLFLEIMPPKTESEDERDILARKKSTLPAHVALTTDVDPADPSPSTITVKGEIGIPKGESAICLSITKPDGSKVSIPGVLVKDGVFAQSVPVMGAGDDGNWQITASFNGNDIAQSGQSAPFLLPVATSVGKQDSRKTRPHASPAVAQFSIGAFVLVAGPPSQLRSQEFTDALAARAEGIMRKRRYTERNSSILSAGSQTPNSRVLTLQNLRTAIQEAGSADPLVLYLLGDTDAGGRFILNGAETLSPADLNATLSSSRGTRPTIVIVDGYRAGAFAETLDRAGRVLIASTGSGTVNIAIFSELKGKTGTGGGAAGKSALAEPRAEPLVSFSHFLFDAINLGKTLNESFAYASNEITALQGPVRLQVPNMIAGDETLSQLPIGSAVDPATEVPSDRLPPVIIDMSPTQSFAADVGDLELEVEVFDNQQIETVRAILGAAGTGNERTMALHLDTATGLYRMSISEADLPQTPQKQVLVPVSVVARDTSGNLSAPVITSIVVEEGVPMWFLY